MSSCILHISHHQFDANMREFDRKLDANMRELDRKLDANMRGLDRKLDANMREIRQYIFGNRLLDHAEASTEQKKSDD